ncbi:MAG: sugar transferase [Chitinophagales bacterium]|nr:sugar transferase [Chitinophagales bacterium]
MKKLSKLIWAYVIFDYFAAMAAWFMLFVFRKVYIEAEPYEIKLLPQDINFVLGLFLLPIGWIFLHYISGTYTDVYRKSRLNEMAKTFFISLLGVTIVFFLFLLDDLVQRYSDYYFTFLVLLFAQFLFTFFGRLIILNFAKENIKSKKFGFNTLIIGSNQQAEEVYNELNSKSFSFGYRFKGYIELNGCKPNRLTKELPRLGSLNELEKVIKSEEIEEVIIAIESSEHQQINYIINTISGKQIYIKIIPDLYDILSGTAKINHIVGTAFIEIPPTVLSEWEVITKRWFDVLSSLAALVILFLPMLIVAIIIKLTSKGDVFYKQERLGQFGKPFDILKFRSMYTDAEKSGPQLTSDNDKRITPIGHFMRKYRIDELPQFINVIKGEMSIVGPRAERQYFADQLMEQAPYYKQIWKVKPGITSLGMVKYGYAGNVSEMLKRLKYDIIYIENMGILLDAKVLIYTVLTVITGKGK